MYLPKSKQKKPKQPQGTVIDPKTGLQFNGKFVMDFLGNIFKGDKITSKSEPLVLIPYSHSSDKEKYTDTFYSKEVKPTPKEYEKGSFPRFFVKDGRTGKIVEETKEGYSRYKKESKLYIRTLRIEWYITGEPEDQIINGYLYPGTKSKNQDVIKQAEELLPGISEQILKNPEQFVVK